MRPDPRKKKVCNFCADKVILIDFKDSPKLKRYMTDRGKLLPRRITGTCAHHQRMLKRAAALSRELAQVAFVMNG